MSDRLQVQESDAIRERTPGEKRAYVEGYAAGIKAAAALARIYEGQSDIGGRVERAGKVTAGLLEETIVDG